MTSLNEKFLYVLKTGIRGGRPGSEPVLDAAEVRKLFSLSQAHGLFPLVFDTLCRHPSVTRLDAAELSSLKKLAVSQAAVQALAEAEFRQLTAALGAEGLRPIVVKGIVCRSLYPKGDLRRSCDEDMLVPAEEIPHIAEIFKREGLKCAEDETKEAEELAFASERTPLRVELHGKPFPSASDAYGHFNEYFTDVYSRAVTDVNSGVRTMCPTDHLFYLICHALKHFMHSGFGIRQICDIVLFAEKFGGEIDWQLIYKHCSELRAEKFAAAVLCIGRDKLGFDLSRACIGGEWTELIDASDPEAMLDDVFDAGSYGGSTDERLRSSNITLEAASSANSGKRRRTSVAASLFPSAKKLSGRYPYLKKAPFLLPVAWISRTVSYAFEPHSVRRGTRSLDIGSRRLCLLEKYGIIGR